MKTHFSIESLSRPEIAEANVILKDCVHYGFCIPVCPTYVLLGDEKDSPRGRIELIREMLESHTVPRAATVKHLDRCLSCNACMSTCGARVDYMHLIDRARAYIETNYRRPNGERVLRWLLVTILPNPILFGILIRVAQLCRPLTLLLPAGLRSIVKMVPRNIAHEVQATPGVYPTEGERRYRVLLHVGCVQQSLGMAITAATVRLLTRYGCEVVVSNESACCGALELHMGWETRARDRAKRTLVAWETELDRNGLDAIVINTSGCGTVIKDYPHLFAGDPKWKARAERIARLSMDVTEFAQRLPINVSDGQSQFIVAYHDACSLLHGQKITSQPRRLLKDAGFLVRDVPERHFCCGSAGTYNILQQRIAEQLGRRKAAHIESTDAGIIAAGNLGCIMQISRYTSLPVVHTIELLDWATGGPLPPALKSVELYKVPAAKSNQVDCGGHRVEPAKETGANAFW